jgi:hypothetical protein
MCVGPHITHVDFVVYTIADLKTVTIPRVQDFIDKMVLELEECIRNRLDGPCLLSPLVLQLVPSFPSS